MSAISTLTNLGFTEGDVAPLQAVSDELGMSKDYPHKVLAVLTKGDITAVIEQNVSEDHAAGVDTITKHPAILILESPKGRVAISNHDDDGENQALIASVVEDLA